jgi:hypothetical protein
LNKIDSASSTDLEGTALPFAANINAALAANKLRSKSNSGLEPRLGLGLGLGLEVRVRMVKDRVKVRV